MVLNTIIMKPIKITIIIKMGRPEGLPAGYYCFNITALSSVAGRAQSNTWGLPTWTMLQGYISHILGRKINLPSVYSSVKSEQLLLQIAALLRGLMSGINNIGGTVSYKWLELGSTAVLWVPAVNMRIGFMDSHGKSFLSWGHWLSLYIFHKSSRP